MFISVILKVNMRCLDQGLSFTAMTTLIPPYPPSECWGRTRRILFVCRGVSYTVREQADTRDPEACKGDPAPLPLLREGRNHCSLTFYNSVECGDGSMTPGFYTLKKQTHFEINPNSLKFSHDLCSPLLFFLNPGLSFNPCSSFLCSEIPERAET